MTRTANARIPRAIAGPVYQSAGSLLAALRAAGGKARPADLNSAYKDFVTTARRAYLAAKTASTGGQAAQLRVPPSIEVLDGAYLAFRSHCIQSAGKTRGLVITNSLAATGSESVRNDLIVVMRSCSLKQGAKAGSAGRWPTPFAASCF